MKYIMWLFRALLFFALFVFALNNQQVVAVHFLLGNFLQAPLIVVILVVFLCGLSLGVLVMTPRWWKRRKHEGASTAAQPKKAAPEASTTLPHGI